jgi:hypothetical protein
MIGRRDQEPVQIAGVARDQKGQNLTSSVPQDAIAARQPVGEHESWARHVALGNDVDARRKACLVDT